MKKALSLLMAFLMLFSSLCVGANAGDAVPEQAYGKVETEDGRIVLTDDELKEKFGIEKILLPEGFEPVGYVYYDGCYTGISPEYIIAVLNDGTTIEVKTGDDTCEGELKIGAYCHHMDKRLNLHIFITKNSKCDSFVFLLGCKWESPPFSKDFDWYKQKISEYYDGFIHDENPKEPFVLDDYICFTGNPTIDSALNIIWRSFRYYPLHMFLRDIVMETARFVFFMSYLFFDYYSKELFSNT